MMVINDVNDSIKRELSTLRTRLEPTNNKQTTTDQYRGFFFGEMKS